MKTDKSETIRSFLAIELDEEAIKELQKLDAPNLEIIHNDILKTDISVEEDMMSVVESEDR